MSETLAHARLRGIYRGAYGEGQLRREVLDEGDDPSPTVQSGSNRLEFNLGDGCNWRRPRHNWRQ